MGALQVTVDSVDSIIDACSIDFSVFSVHSCEEKDVYLSLATALGRWNRERERERIHRAATVCSLIVLFCEAFTNPRLQEPTFVTWRQGKTSADFLKDQKEHFFPGP